MAKTYIDWASCKAINGQFGEFFNMSFNIEKLQQYANEKWYVNLTMSKRREVGQYGDTHYFTLNEYNPNNNNTNNNQSTDQVDDSSQDDVSVDDLPF